MQGLWLELTDIGRREVAPEDDGSERATRVIEEPPAGVLTIEATSQEYGEQYAEWYAVHAALPALKDADLSVERAVALSGGTTRLGVRLTYTWPAPYRSLPMHERSKARG